MAQSADGSTVHGDLVQIGSAGTVVLAGPPGTPPEHAARRLAVGTRARLDREVGRRGLRQPEPIRVRWSSTGRPVQAPAGVLPAGQTELTGDITQISALLRALPRRQLVVLGAPGAGKSVLALLLALDLLRDPEPDEPVPVLLPLSSWRPRLGLREWMARQILELHPELADTGEFGRDAVPRMIDAGRVMPVLDGLDELPASLHARAVQAIEEAVADGVPLLVTCRSDDYQGRVEQTGRHLTRAAVVELEPVEPDAAIAFLRNSHVAGDDRWEPVFHGLRAEPESPLGRALSTPLMLDLARTAYRPPDTDPGRMLDAERFGDHGVLEDHLLERYVPAVYAERPGTRYRAGRARRWLEFIARQMRRHDTVDFAWWQVDSMVAAPLVGLVHGVVFGWFFHLLFGLVGGVVCGVVTGVLAALAHAYVRSELQQVYVTDDVHDPRLVLRRYAAFAALLSSVVAGIAGVTVAVWLRSALDVTPWVAWGHGVVFGLLLGFATLLGTAWGSYRLSLTWFRLTNRLPWRLMAFLEDAHELGVLRQTGAVHQFRHARLQERLSGPSPGDARSDHRAPRGGSERAQPRWKAVLLPFVPPAQQLGIVLTGLILVLMLNDLAAHGELDYRSGDEPHTRNLTHCTYNTDPAACVTTPVLTWELPVGAARRTVLTAPPRRSHIAALDGRIKTEGCAEASVEVTLTVDGLAPLSFTLGLEEHPIRAKAPFPRSIRFDGGPVSLTLRRLDREPCGFRFVWTGPGVRDDLLEHARKRFTR